jgi:hypothetical protein
LAEELLGDALSGKALRDSVKAPGDDGKLAHSPQRPTSAATAPEREQLAAALEALHPRLAELYEGALRAYADEANPESLAQAAYSMRELFDALHLAARQPRTRTVAMGTKVRQLRDAWADAVRTSQNFQPATGAWSGEVDDALDGFLSSVRDFMAWLAIEHPKRRVQIDALVDRLDPGPGRLAAPLLRARRSELEQLDAYMNVVTHHGHRPTRADFASRLAQSERFLWELVQPIVAPRPYEDRELLDSLLGRH